MKFVVGQKVRWTRYEVTGEEECRHCGSYVEVEDQVSSEHTVTEVYEHGTRSGIYYSYVLDGEHFSVHEKQLEAV